MHAVFATGHNTLAPSTGAPATGCAAPVLRLTRRPKDRTEEGDTEEATRAAAATR